MPSEPSAASRKRETIYTAVTVRIRLRETKEHALREQENAVRLLRREGYDAIPWGFAARSHEKPSANATPPAFRDVLLALARLAAIREDQLPDPEASWALR